MTIHLLDDSYADSDSIQFIPGTYQFFLQTAQGEQINVTDLLNQSDKMLIGGTAYDQNEDLRRISEAGGTNHPLPGSAHGSGSKPYDKRGFWEIFSSNVADDLRSLPGGATNILIPVALIAIAVALIVKAK